MFMILKQKLARLGQMLAFTGGALAVLLAGQVATAQNLFAPVATVNDQVITAYELSQRIAFLTLLRAPGDVRALATSQLVNERLQLGAAKQLGVELSAEDLAAGMSEFAARANLDTEKFLLAIAQGGVAAETFRDFVSAGLLWRQVARTKFISQVNISQAEIDRAAALAEPTGGVRVLLSEIVLPASDAQSTAASTQRAISLSKITSLTAFASAASRYSVAASKGDSGQLDWRNLADLPPAVASQVLALSPGQVTAPIPIEGGVALYQLRELQETQAGSDGGVTLEYAQFLIPGGRSTAALEQAGKVRNRVDTCDDLYTFAKGQPDEVLQRNVSQIGQIPADIAQELAGMDNGEVSTNLTRNGGQTLVFLMLCGRTLGLTDEFARDDIRNQLRNQRLQSLASGYLQELHADAYIEILNQ